MYNIDLEIFGKFIYVTALLLQLNHLRSSNTIFPLTFILLAISSYIVSYEYYKRDRKYTTRVYLRIFTATVILLIGLMSM